MNVNNETLPILMGAIHTRLTSHTFSLKSLLELIKDNPNGHACDLAVIVGDWVNTLDDIVKQEIEPYRKGGR